MISAMASQITILAVVYSTIYSGTADRKHQSFGSLAFVRGFHRWLVNSPHKRASNAENVSIWWRHHELITVTCNLRFTKISMTGILYIPNECARCFPIFLWLFSCIFLIWPPWFHVIYLVISFKEPTMTGFQSQKGDRLPHWWWDDHEANG